MITLIDCGVSIVPLLQGVWKEISYKQRELYYFSQNRFIVRDLGQQILCDNYKKVVPIPKDVTCIIFMFILRSNSWISSNQNGCKLIKSKNIA